MDVCTRLPSGCCGDVKTIRTVQRVCSVTAGWCAQIGLELAIKLLVVVAAVQSFRRRRRFSIAPGEINLNVRISPGTRRSSERSATTVVSVSAMSAVVRGSVRYRSTAKCTSGCAKGVDRRRNLLSWSSSSGEREMRNRRVTYEARGE